VSAFVGYGGVGGARAIEHLCLVLAELQVATVRQTLTLSMLTEFENFRTFAPGEYQIGFLNTLFDQLISWSQALEGVRKPPSAEVAELVA